VCKGVVEREDGEGGRRWVVMMGVGWSGCRDGHPRGGGGEMNVRKLEWCWIESRKLWEVEMGEKWR